ncbi:MAG: prolyl oligopeptidase family serine peptidase, partial [Thermoguttaceae bacterium]|nr:prolyl oligopeptidase family serine peptidase [Thermoguttaceae bacterium]
HNVNKGVGAKLMPEFAFDAKTPPMCFIHGDADGWSSMNSIAVYSKLKSMGIPAEVHVYAKVGHAFGGLAKGNHIGDWFNRAYEWMRVMGYVN